MEWKWDAFSGMLLYNLSWFQQDMSRDSKEDNWERRGKYMERCGNDELLETKEWHLLSSQREELEMFYESSFES